MEKLTSGEILKIALESGADLAGIANIRDLKEAPAFTVITKMPKYNGVGTYMRGENDTFLQGVMWAEGMKSVIVLAYHHPVADPKLDYWLEGYTTIGNKRLIDAGKKLKSRLIEDGIETFGLNYHVEKGGIFLKDSAVVAGLGCIGKNNLLVTPQYGPHVRLRALGISLDLPSTGPSGYDPCTDCEIKCWERCKKSAFAKQIYSDKQLGRNELPGRVGNFNRTVCNVQMKEDEDNMKLLNISLDAGEETVNTIKYCRACEYACPIGK